MTERRNHLFDAVERHVSAFEAQLERNPDADPAEFLPAASDAEYGDVLQELLRVHMDHCAALGRPVQVDDYRAQFPQLFDDPSAVAPLLFEEYRLQLLSGRSVRAEDYARRYNIDVSDWPSSLPADSMAQHFSRLAGAGNTDPEFLTAPDAGSRLLDFEVVGTLGRGAFSRVYLARQFSMANRLVVLKFSSLRMCEADRLARLQHTNIVPVYSVHQHEQASVLCMPYFGSCTLQSVMKSGGGDSAGVKSGRQLVSTLATLEDQTLTSLHVTTIPAGGPAADTTGGQDGLRTEPRPPLHAALNALDHEGTALWIARQLAEGLAHAHSRGILHRDLKPANVLLTEEGQPMILDFNLSARQSATELTSDHGIVGGTLPYMSPEQIESLETLQPVDQRTDIYALGILLFEMLSGQLPFSLTDTAPTSMLQQRQQAKAVISRVLGSTSPDTRAIICRCLAYERGERYQTADEVAEDLDRHLRQFPLKHAAGTPAGERLRKWARRHPRLTSATAVVSISSLLLIAAFTGLWRSGHNLRISEARQQYDAFMHRLPETRSQAFAAIFGEQTPDVALQELRSMLRGYGIQDATTPLDTATMALLPPDRQTQLQEAVSELQSLIPCVEQKQSGGSPDAAWISDGSSLAGYQLGVHHFVRNDFIRCSATMNDYCENEPDNFAARFVLGLALRAQQESAAADAAFAACIALEPDNALAWYERGLCALEAKQNDRAAEFLSQSLNRNPELVPAWVSRGIALRRAGRLPEALSDIDTSIRLGFPETRIWFIRSEIQQALGNTEAAEQDLQQGLAAVPTDPRSWVARALQQLNKDPEAALQDLYAAQRLEPGSHDAFRNIPMVLSEYLKRPDDAVRELDRAVLTYPNDAYLWGGRGVLHARAGRTEPALADAKHMLDVSGEPLVVYQAACIYALCASADPEYGKEAIRLLARSLRSQADLTGLAANDPDLNAIREQPEFRRVLTASAILSTPVPPTPAASPGP